MKFSGRRGRYDKKARQTLMAIESVTQKRKNEVYLPMHGHVKFLEFLIYSGGSNNFFAGFLYFITSYI